MLERSVIMFIKIVYKTAQEFLPDRIPTRFDDIQKEIAEARLEEYYKQATSQPDTGKTYKLGSVISEALGKKLNKIG